MSDTGILVHERRPDPMAETGKRPDARALKTESRVDPATPTIERAAIPLPPVQGGARPRRRRLLPFAILSPRSPLARSSQR
jgi:hypothetical protein